MKKSTKAVLLSALVFPGVGHIFLKKYMTGAVLISASFVALYFLISETVDRAFQIAQKIQNGDVQLDVDAITDLVSKQSTGAGSQLLNIATATLIICWVIGIIDTYRVGRLQDNSDEVLVNR